MKKIFTILMVVGSLSFAFSQNRPSSDEQAVIQLEREKAKAFVQGDIKTLERIFADELIQTSDGGIVSSKQSVLQNLRPLTGVTVDLSDVNARVFDKSAVVTGIVMFRIHTVEREQADYQRFTDTFVKQQKGWQLIATHQQRIQPWIARELRDSELKPLNALDCSQESSIRSESYEIPTYIRFNNTTARPVVIYWLNYEGQRDPTENQRVTIGPGQSGFRVTYVTHPFLVADESGKCLAIYQPAREPSLAVIR